MQIQKDIYPFKDSSCISVSYTERFFDGKDTAVQIYDRYKISVLLSDGLNAVKGNTLIQSEKYTILFFRPDELHFAHFTQKGVHKYLDFFVPGSFFNKMCIPRETLHFLTDTSETRINYITEKNKTDEMMHTAVDALKTDSTASGIKLFSVFLQILLLCGECYEKQKDTPQNQSVPAVVTKTIQHISENFEQKLSLNALSKSANCSVAYLSRLFKQYVGTTVYNYITVTRIANAQKLLKNGATVTEACFSSGFEDCSNFIRTFKKLTGETPLSYKKKGL